MECECSKRNTIPSLVMKIGDHTVPQVTRFRHLGAIPRIQAGRSRRNENMKCFGCYL
uniref:Uncharacterized protein n=1 Tax=Cajanus cajan TaxID=3821 RepID=A0A151U9S0_CAJCA|nr:hypothetical protein KK1_020268 [Cajanus cajan]